MGITMMDAAFMGAKGLLERVYSKNDSIMVASEMTFVKISQKQDIKVLDYFLSVLKKLGYAAISERRINQLNKTHNQWEIESLFYHCVLMVYSSIDSLACTLNEYHNREFNSKTESVKTSIFKDNFVAKLPREYQEVISKQKDTLETLRKFRNAIAHRNNFDLIPAGTNFDKPDVFWIPKDPDKTTWAILGELGSTPLSEDVMMDAKKFIASMHDSAKRLIEDIFIEIARM